MLCWLSTEDKEITMVSSKVNARHLIIDLLLASEGMMTSIKQMVLAAGLFGISENSIRVAVTRLSSEGAIIAAARGVYQLSDQSLEWATIKLSYQAGMKQTKPWQQQYLAVLTGALGRVDRTALKRRERALKQYGFRELEQGVFIRPDNLAATFDDVLAHLKATGLEAEAKMCQINFFDQQTNEVIPTLWPTENLNKNYQKYTQLIEQWLVRAPLLSLEDAARESLLLGRQTISLLNSDPVLPEPFVDVAARQQFAMAVKQLDQMGHAFWQQLFELNFGPAAAIPKKDATSTSMLSQQFS